MKFYLVVFSMLVASMKMHAGGNSVTEFEVAHLGGMLLPPESVKNEVITGFAEAGVKPATVNGIRKWLNEIRVLLSFNIRQLNPKEGVEIYGPQVGLSDFWTHDLNQYFSENVATPSEGYLANYSVLSSKAHQNGCQYLVEFKIVVPLEDADPEKELVVCEVLMEGHRRLNFSSTGSLSSIVSGQFHSPVFRLTNKKGEAEQHDVVNSEAAPLSD